MDTLPLDTICYPVVTTDVTPESPKGSRMDCDFGMESSSRCGELKDCGENGLRVSEKKIFDLDQASNIRVCFCVFFTPFFFSKFQTFGDGGWADLFC